jgi:hypothetical protein
MRSIAGFIAVGLALAASPALACKGKNVQFSDSFRQVDKSWGVDPDAVSVEDGKVKIKADATSNYVVLYKGPKFTDADLCVTIQIPLLYGGRAALRAGAVFWADNYDSYYAFLIQPDGRASLVRLDKGTSTPVVNLRAVDSLKTQPGDKNVLRLTTKGTKVTAYINDELFASVSGRVPDGGGQFGLFAQSEDAHRDTWKFTDLKVTDLPPQ